jgi:hypothetical protein
MVAGNSSCTTLMQDLMKIETERIMKSHRRTLHELTMRVPKESTEGDICRPPGARRQCGGGGPGGGCAHKPVGTYLYLHAVGDDNKITVPCLAR